MLSSAEFRIQLFFGGIFPEMGKILKRQGNFEKNDGKIDEKNKGIIVDIYPVLW
jgi:hypothetical protein